MNEFIENQKEELKRLLHSVPALITLYSVSYRGERLMPAEERSAIIYLSVLCNQGPDELRDFFTDVRKTFKNDLNHLDKELPKGQTERKRKIEERLLPVKFFINTLPEGYRDIFRDALLGFMTHTRSAVGDTLESVMLPFVSDNLRRIQDTRMREVI